MRPRSALISSAARRPAPCKPLRLPLKGGVIRFFLKDVLRNWGAGPAKSATYGALAKALRFGGSASQRSSATSG